MGFFFHFCGMRDKFKKGLVVLCLLSGMQVSAQTNFRSLSFEEALQVARQEQKLVLIDFYTSWCGPCKQMARDVFPQKKMGEYINPRLVAVKLDAEKEGKDAARLYGVKAYPTYVVVTPDRRLVNSFAGAMSADEFIRKLEKALDPDLEAGRVREAFAAGNRSGKIVEAYTDQIWATANKVNAALKRDTIMNIVSSYYNGLTDEERMLPANYFVYQKYMNSVDSRQFQFLAEHLRQFPAEDQSKMKDLIARQLKTTAMYYMMGRTGETTMANVRHYINLLELADDSSDGKFFRFILDYDTSTPERLFTTSSKIFDYVDDTLMLQSFWFNFPNHFNRKDTDQRQHAADFLERMIPRIPPMEGMDFSKLVDELRKPQITP